MVPEIHQSMRYNDSLLSAADAFEGVNVDATGARMMEIAENLDRAELTALERDEHIAEWIRLAKKQADLQSPQVEAIESKRSDGRGHRPESGTNRAARELGIEEEDARRATKVAGLSGEAKEGGGPKPRSYELLIG